jgi:hypothetical protein
MKDLIKLIYETHDIQLVDLTRESDFIIER